MSEGADAVVLEEATPPLPEERLEEPMAGGAPPAAASEESKPEGDVEATNANAEEEVEVAPVVEENTVEGGTAVADPAPPDDAAEAKVDHPEDPEAAAKEHTEKPEEEAKPAAEEEGGIWEPPPNCVLNGRGANVNSNPGNKKFRALCFARKAQFEAGNHACKRRIATEIVTTSMEQNGARFLRKRTPKGPWFEMTKEQAILKASQVIRDYKRPDRMAQRELMASSGKKRNRSIATPMDDVHIPPPPAEPIVENPHGVNKNDVLSGRGAFVNGHEGNHQLRRLAMERKKRFDAGNYTEKKTLAFEIVYHIKNLTPAGRFLRRHDPVKKPLEKGEVLVVEPEGDEKGWVQLNEEDSVHKACQVMRDLFRADRHERDERRKLKKLKKEGKLPPAATTTTPAMAEQPLDIKPAAAVAQDAGTALPAGGSEVVEEAVAAAEAAMDKALEAANTATETSKGGEVAPSTDVMAQPGAAHTDMVGVVEEATPAHNGAAQHIDSMVAEGGVAPADVTTAEEVSEEPMTMATV